MKLKYYMRGLGIGIIVTALLMGVALSGRKETMTDEEIRQRALEMGMVEEDDGVLADDLGKEKTEPPEETSEELPETVDIAVSENETGDEAAQPDADPAKSGEQAETESGSDEADASDAGPEKSGEAAETENGSDNADASDEGPAQSGNQTETGSVIITVHSGDGSRSVANRLQEAGVIEDAAAFDVFLCQNGYDKRIAAGDHEIPAGATEQEIAEALTR